MSNEHGSDTGTVLVTSLDTGGIIGTALTDVRISGELFRTSGGLLRKDSAAIVSDNVSSSRELVVCNEICIVEVAMLHGGGISRSSGASSEVASWGVHKSSKRPCTGVGST